MLFLNQHNSPFTEQANSKVEFQRTDWSWSGHLFGDYDQDREKQDIFISQTVFQKDNDLDFIKFASDEQIKKSLAIPNW